MHKVAAVIPTKNVAHLIRPTLESLRFCDEVVIVDMFSTDSTKAVCLEYPNVRFLERSGYIYENFNYGVEKATSDWIIRLDSDEVISPELQRSIVGILRNPSPPYHHYNAVCHLYICGMRLHNGYGVCNRTTLFRKGTACYAVVSEHEGLTVSGPAGQLQGHYDHYSVPTLSAWLAKYNYYTDRDSERIPIRPPLPWWRVLWHAANHFRGNYFGRGGLRRDGYLGFAVACLAAFAQILLELKVWERYAREQLRGSPDCPDHPNSGFDAGGVARGLTPSERKHP